ncbi:DExH-box ATP-dependent RNA helicase DExH17 isoform X3 [Populus alba x Populus x berolinensis]|nr:DExH-box ATP-dependent RNA helicase DExH17 isoform X3 [Populus alba x Populus x berolinensis]
MPEITLQKVNELSHHQMIWTDKDGFLLKPLEPGRLMTRYYLKFNTMKHVMQTPENCSLENALNVICHAEEIAWIQLRRNEKKLLNDINIDKDCRIRFHINGDKQKRKKRIQTREEKIFVLANDCLTGDPSVHDLSLTQDMNSICSNGCRIARCMKEYFIFKRNYKGAINSTLLAKSLYQKLWDDSPYLLKQLPGIGMVTAKALHSMGIKSFDTLAEADPRRIEILTGRKFPFGNHIKDSLLSLPPKVSMSIEENECHRRGMSKFVVTLTRLSQPLQSSKRHYADMIVGTEEDNLIHFHEKIRVDEFSSPYSAAILLSIPQQKKLTLKANLIFEEYIGLDFHQKLLLMKESNPETNKNRCKQPSLFPPPGDVCVIEDESETTSYEGEPGFEIQNDSCKIISEQTIFEHIREKAKNFPLLTTSSNVCSPSSEAMLLTRKRRRDKAIELDSAPNATEETEGSKISLAFLNVTSEQRERERYGHDSYKLMTPKHHTSPGRFVVDLVDDSGGLPSKSETSGLNGPTKDTIFDHIRKKAQYFPALSRTMQFDSVAGTKECSFENQPDFCIAASQVLKEVSTDRSTGDTIIISDSETRRGIDAYSTEPGSRVKDDKFSRSPHGERGSSSAPPKVSCINTDPSCIEMLPFDISMIKHNTLLAGSRNSTAHGRKKQSSPNGSERHCCSLEMAGKNREVDSFLGFTSVFSFL